MSQLDLFYLSGSGEFCERIEGHLVSVPPDTIILRAAYLSESQASGTPLITARQQLQTTPAHLLLRLVQSTDGPPFRTGIAYVKTGEEEVSRAADFRILAVRTGSTRVRAVRYAAPGINEEYSWKTDMEEGRPGFFMTGAGGVSAFWRTSRLEVDALGRYVVTLAPARLAHGIAAPNFDAVPPPLQTFLADNFQQFKQAVARNAHLDVINRANHLAEGILDYCLSSVQRPVPDTLFNRLKEARKILDQNAKDFLLTQYGYHLAHRIRLLHGRIHADQTVGKKNIVRPEVGMSVAIDVSELLLDVGLGHY
jgi:hypothetical protein